MRQLSTCFALVVWVLLSSCSSSPSQHPSLGMTSEEIRVSTDAQQLKSLQKSLAEQLTEKEKEDFPKEFSLLHSLSQRVIELETQKLEKELKARRIKAEGALRDKISLPDLAHLKKQIENDKDLSSGLLPEILSPIVREQTDSQAAMRALEAETNQQTLTAEQRATVYHKLFMLSGDSKWKEIRDKQMDIIIKAIHTATDKQVFSSDLEKKIDFVRSIYVEEPKKVIEDMHTLYAVLYARRHAQARQLADREAAFKVLQQLAKKPDFLDIKSKLRPSYAEQIAEGYANDVAESIARGRNVAESYRLYQREIEVRNLLDLKPKAHTDTAKLIQQLADKFHLINKENPYAALGLLLAQQVIDPKTADLKQALEHQIVQITDTTIRSISLSPFRSRYNDLNYGEVITPLISQHLYDALGSDIQIIEQNTDEGFDARITGNILEVKVESSQARNKKQMLVNVGEVQRTNPAYIAWLERSPKERKKLPRPDETILEQKQQTVFVTSTLHRKTGVIAISYRLIDKKKRVIFPDSITLQAEHEDESNEGLEVGELIVPYKIAKLPSDTEILQNLSQNVASTIAGNLAGVLLNQEIEYLKAADKAATQNDCAEEVENLAKAISLLTNKKKDPKDTEVPIRRLVDRSLSCL